MKLIARPDLRKSLKLLEDLEELSDNIEDAIDTFSLHFRVASIDLEVKNQMELLRKSRNGLKAAKDAKYQLEKVYASFPEDKTAKRALNDAEVMIRRFLRLESQAGKIISQLSKKTMPPALVKYASTIVRMLKGKLMDPKTIKVKPWQYDGWQGGVIYQMVIDIQRGGDLGKIRFELSEDTGSRDGPGFQTGSISNKQMSPKEVLAEMLERLSGWKGLKSEQTIDRTGITAGIVSALNSALRSMSAWDSGQATIERNGMEVEASYRSNNLPKEGAYDVGASSYDDMVDKEISQFRKAIERSLGSLMKHVKKIDIDDGEKSWIYVTVTLK
jgi:hypothetical protein